MSEITDLPEHESQSTSETDNAPRTYSGAFMAVVAIALLAAIGGLIWCAVLGSRLSSAQTELADAKQQNTQLAASLREINARLQVATDELGKSVGLTQKELDTRAQAIIHQEQVDSQRLANAQQQTAQQVSTVSNEVSSVKTDVGGVKTDLGKTQSDLATAISQLQSVRGDLSTTNSVIARNHDELVLLEHKGDRNYYEFSLVKGQKKPVGTISMELKKVDPKKNIFTLEITSDDKLVTKKDKGINEPLQFYSGKDPALFEVVVNTINSKNQVSGYLSVPKNAPAPVTAQ
jgi:F0F1-type ATP synthase membrane subunit b/b'